MGEIFAKILEIRLTKNGNIVYNIILYFFIVLLLIKISDYITTKLGNKEGKTAIQWKYLKQVFRVVIIVLGLLGILHEIPSMEKVATTIVTSSSIIVAAIGLAAQETMANAINGMFITIFKPFVVGDRVRLNQMGLVGFIEDINLRHTVVRTFENNRVMIPNTTMNKENIENFNYEDTRVCNFVEFTVPYGTDIDKAVKIIEEEILNHPLHIDVRSEEDKELGLPEIKVYLKDLTDKGINLRVGVWVETISDSFLMCSDLRKSVYESFRKNNIKIAVPNINIRNR